jgi:hypothetical protein
MSLLHHAITETTRTGAFQRMADVLVAGWRHVGDHMFFLRCVIRLVIIETAEMSAICFAARG